MNDDMAAPVRSPAIKASPLFKDLSGLEFAAVAAFLEPRSVKKKEFIFKEGDAGKEMFILVSGEIGAWVAHPDGAQRRMFNIRPGDFFGEMSIIVNESRSATLTALEDTELLVFYSIDFYRIIFDHPMIGIKMLRAIEKVQNMWLEQNSKYLSDLMRWGETARRRAITDELTGLYNRRFLEESGVNRFAQGAVGPRSVSLMMMDLDFIHRINDRYGLRAGDLAFISVADVLRTLTRPGDIAARLSGDEFALLLPDAAPEHARGIAERIRQTISARKIKIPEGPEGSGWVEFSVSASIGVACAPLHADSWEPLFLAADKALRRSKELGRNQVEMAR